MKPMKILCTPEKLGEKNPTSLLFEGCVEGLETDAIFSHCTHIRRLYIGKHEKPLFNKLDYLNMEQIEYFALNGSKHCILSDRIKQEIQEKNPNVVKYVYLI
jgi:hypothetical protein